MKYLYLAINWILGLLFLIVGLAFVIASSSLAGLLLLLTSLFFLPPIGNFVYSKTNKKISFKGKSIVIVASFILYFFAVNIDYSNSQKKEDIARFNDNREQIIDSIKKELSNEKYDAAISLSDEYLTFDDDEIKELKSLAIAKLNQARKEQKIKESEQKTKNLLATVEKIPASELSRNNAIYKELLALHPDNKTYKDKVDFYTQKINEKEKIRKAEKEREKRIQENIRLKAERRTERIESQFSAWSGAHRNLERFVKSLMNDPDSYEHAKTIYFDKGNHLIVNMTFRGRNGFGGVVKNFIKAKVSLDGRILEIIDQY